MDAMRTVAAAGRAVLAGLVVVVVGACSNGVEKSEDSPEDATNAECSTTALRGRITLVGGVAAGGVTVSLDGPTRSVRLTDANGGYAFGDLERGGPYTIRPSKPGCTFAPAEARIRDLRSLTPRDFVASGKNCTADGGSTIVADTSLVFEATRTYAPTKWIDAEKTLAAPLAVTIPGSVPVVLGNAGNQHMTLSYRPSEHGRTVTCTFRGGSHSPHPTDSIDVEKGKEYRFERCSNGLRPGDIAEIAWVKLHVDDGDNRDPAGLTQVRLGLGGVGGGTLEPPISRADTAALREGFHWNATRPLPETTAEGLPSLWYVLIYVRSQEEIAVLKEIYIHYDSLPLFGSELARYDGQRGIFAHEGDGKGMFVFAMIPGVTYNLLRQGALDGDEVFAAIVPRAVPANARNPDGSVSYEALKRAGFRYEADLPAAAPGLGATSFPSAPAKQALGIGFRNFLKAVAKAVVGVVETVQRVVGVVDRFARGSVELTIATDVRNTDPDFGGTLTAANDQSTPMARAWGARAGQQVTIPGVRVEVRQGPTQLLTTLFTDKTDANGVARMKIAKNEKTYLCLTTTNEAAYITELLLPIQICDFATYSAQTFGSDTTYTLKLQSGYMNALAQVSEGRAYLRDVVGFTPRQAEIMVGQYANLLGSVNTDRSFTPCFGYPNPKFDAIIDTAVAALNVVPVVGPLLSGALAGAVTTVYGTADMFLTTAKTQDALLSRGVATHEYGHFALCSLMWDQNPANISGAYTDAMIEEVSALGSPSSGSQGAFLNEAFADFFTGQVAAGVNYFAPYGAVEGLQTAWCNGRRTDCLDENVLHGADGYLQQIQHVAQTLQDAFDGHPRLTNLPGYGAFWDTSKNPGPYFTPLTSGFAVDPMDEPIALVGSGYHDLFVKWNSRGAALNEATVWPALVDVMRDAGYDWCQMCSLFVLHDPSVAANADKQTVYARCEQQPFATWLGAAPDRGARSSCNYNPIVRASVATGGAQASDLSTSSALSSDGSVVAFRSVAPDLVSGDTDGMFNIFVRDIAQGKTTRVDVSNSGAQGDSSGSTISKRGIDGSGRYIVFDSYAGNLVSDDTNGWPDSFLHDRVLHTTTRVSVSTTGAQGAYGGFRPAIARGGRFIAFTSFSKELGAGGGDGVLSIYVRDTSTGETLVTSVSDAGAVGTLNSDNPVLSADGRFVAFESFSSNLVAGDTNGVGDVFVRDRVLARTVRASVSTDGGQADGVCEHADISDDGRFVVFESAAANLVPGDTNGVKDVFVRDLVQGKTTRVGVAQGDAESYGAVISGDGSRVAFVSRSTNLVAGDTNGQPDVFLFDRSSGVLTRVSVVPGGAQANGANAEPAIGLRGDVVSWSSEASNLVNNDTNGKADVFVRFFGP